MEITTETSVIYDLIEKELKKRWEELTLEAQGLPFTNKRVIPLDRIGAVLYKDFAQNVVNQLKPDETGLV